MGEVDNLEHLLVFDPGAEHEIEFLDQGGHVLLGFVVVGHFVDPELRGDVSLVVGHESGEIGGYGDGDVQILFVEIEGVVLAVELGGGGDDWGLGV